MAKAAKKATTKKQRQGRKDRPGVTILYRSNRGRKGWVGRWVDPDDGKTKTRWLARLGVTTEAGAAQWAKAHSKKIGERRRKIEQGAAIYRPISPEAALDEFIELWCVRARPATKRSYRLAVGQLVTWCAEAGIRETGALRSDSLARFRAWLLARPVSSKTASSYLTQLRTFLNWIRKHGRLPYLTKDDIGDNLGGVTVGTDLPAILRGPEIAKMIRAALRHDRECYRLTREEKAGVRKPGSTRRHEARSLAPFTLFLVLSGMRRGEAAGLRWSQVDLEQDEIRIDSSSKTKAARSVGLDVSPSLRRLLARLRLRSPGEFVFGEAGYTGQMLKRGLERLRFHGAPEAATWQHLRRTCAAYGSSAAGIWGGAAAFMSAKRCGHSVAVAEKFYADAVRGIPRDATTLESAMGIEALAEEVIEALGEPAAGGVAAAG